MMPPAISIVAPIKSGNTDTAGVTVTPLRMTGTLTASPRTSETLPVSIVDVVEDGDIELDPEPPHPTTTRQITATVVPRMRPDLTRDFPIQIRGIVGERRHDDGGLAEVVD